MIPGKPASSYATIVKGANIEVRFLTENGKQCDPKSFEKICRLQAHDALTLPPDTHFTLRNKGETPADIIFILLES